MKTILVPTDFSIHATYALDMAIMIAKKHAAKIVVLNAMDYSAHIDSMYPVNETKEYLVDIYTQLKSTITEKLKLIEEKVKEEAVKVECVAEVGFLHEVIPEMVLYKEVDLVVMGTKGVTGIKDIFMGSNTEKVVRTLEIPVLTVNTKFTQSTIDNIVFVHEFGGDDEGAGFQYVTSFAKSFDAKIHLLRINEPANFMTTRDCMTAMDDFAQKWKINNYSKTQYDHHFFEHGLTQASHLIGADVIAMGTHGRRGISRALYGSLTENAVNHLSTPIFSFREP